jgi:hypothetical protein
MIPAGIMIWFFGIDFLPDFFSAIGISRTSRREAALKGIYHYN